jgi:hypothetical protein
MASAAWLDLAAASHVVAEHLRTPLGAAGAALCTACATGAIRWRELNDCWAVPIRTVPPLTRQVWARGHIYPERCELVDRSHRYEMIVICRADLLAYFRNSEMRDQQSAPPVSAVETASRTPPIAPRSAPKTKAAADRMRADLEAGRLTPKALRALRPTELVSRYGDLATRQILVEARKKVLGEC